MSKSSARKRNLMFAWLVVFACFFLVQGNIYGQGKVKKKSGAKVGIDYRPNLRDEAKTKILILATPHLNTIKDCFQPAALESLLKVLQSYKPEVIGVEAVPPAILEDMERRGGYFNEIIESFDKKRADFGHKMQNISKVSRTEAETKADALLQTKSALDADTRLKLIAALLAAYDYDSAVLQWSYLPESRRGSNQTLPDEITAQLNKDLASPNERLSIGVVLAKRLGLHKVVGIDDHFDEELLNRVVTQFSKEFVDNPEVKAVTKSTFYAESEKQLKAACQDSDALLRYYLDLNSPEYASTDVAMQWGVWFRTKLPSGFDRSRVAQWEVRNLNIASRVREATVFYPGKRILIIIGAGHKPFLDSYLSQMLDVKLVQLKEKAKVNAK